MITGPRIHGRRGGSVEKKKHVKILLWKVGGEGGLKKTNLLTVVDGMVGGWVKNLKNVDGS